MLSDLTNEYKNATKQSAEAGYRRLMVRFPFYVYDLISTYRLS